MVLFLPVSLGFSQEKSSSTPLCEIKVEMERKSQEKEEKVYHLPAESKKECEKMAQHHKTNFAPHAISKKKVTFTWKENK